MKKFFILLFINLILAVLQTSFLLEILGPNFTPNLIFAFGFAFLLRDNDSEGSLSLFTGGLIYDLLTLTLIGQSALILILLYEISVLLKRLISRNILFIFLLILVSALLFNYLLSGITGIFTSTLSTIIALILLSTFSSTLLIAFSKTELTLIKNPYK